jgi:hypothetical protein
MITRTLVAALVATASLAVAACGSDPQTPASSSQGRKGGLDAATKKAMLDYAQCMRDHGVDMPDPTFEQGGGRVVQRVKGNEDKVRAAEQACKKYQDKVKPPPMSEQEQKKMKEAALKNSQCMRDHGITNFPDPQFDENGGAMMKFDKSNGINPNSPKFQAAMKACQKDSAGGGMMFGAGPGSGSGK